MPFAFIFLFLLAQLPVSLGVRHQETARFRRFDNSDVAPGIPIPGLQVSEKTSRPQPHFSSWWEQERWEKWSAAMVELEPPPWWTPSSPTRTHSAAVFSVNGAQSGASMLKVDETTNTTRYNHISVAIEYHNLGEEIMTFPERRPREFNVMLATCKTWTADAVVQWLELRKGKTQSFDWGRSGAFALFGFVYIGVAQWFLYVTILTWLFPDAMVFANAPLAVKLKDRTGILDMVGQISVDIFIFGIFIYFPVFYLIKAMFQGKGSLYSRAEAGLRKYRTNMWSDNLANFLIWVPADVVIFSCPMYLRMPLEHLVSIGWTMFMSATRGATEKKEPKEETKSKMVTFRPVEEGVGY